MRVLFAVLVSLALGVASASAEPVGVRVNANIILEPILAVPGAEAFRSVELVRGDEAIFGLWRFSYEDAPIDGEWQAIGLVGISALGEGVEPVIARVWARGEVTSGDSEELRAVRTPPPRNTISAFSLQLTQRRGVATVTLDANGQVEIDGLRLGVTGP